MRRSFLLFCLITPLISASAGEIKQMEFVNQPIKDILFTLAGITGTSIIADDTVKGSASYHFSNTDLDSALQHFLPLYGLSFVKKDGIYYVSRIFVKYNPETKTISVSAKDTPPHLILEKISKAIKKTILFDPLPGEKITINSVGLPVYTMLEIIMRRFDNYTVENPGDYYYIKRKPANPRTALSRKPVSITKKNSLFSISADVIHLKEALSRLFVLSGHEYSLLKRGDSVLENIHFKNKSFKTILRLLLEQANADFTERNGVYYIFDISRNDVLKKLDNREYIKLRNIPVELLPALLPSRLGGSSILKIDRDNNAVILSGSHEETAPVKEFITNLEKEYGKKKAVRIELSFVTADELIKLLPPRLRKIEITRTGNPSTLIIEASKERAGDFITFVHMIDKENRGIAIPLKYIRADDLLKNIPPSISKNNIMKSADPNLVFFKGSEEKLEQFKKDLLFIDKPVPQIKYELLVVQYQQSKNTDYHFSVKGNNSGNESGTTVLGTLGNLINLNIDIVSTFGYGFAVDLNAKLNNSKARIMADTTLNGLTGEEISFRNTNTYRYRDREIDPDTGKLASTGITREITSGLMISINGWVSGDGMITMNVKSTVSKRGADVSSNSGNPPPTSEKVINTHVRTPSGKPVVIGGLFQQEKDVSYQRTPLLSSIPLIGNIFSSRVETLENTELVIYIVPRIEYPDRQKLGAETFFTSYHKQFFSGNSIWN